MKMVKHLYKFIKMIGFRSPSAYLKGVRKACHVDAVWVLYQTVGKSFLLKLGEHLDLSEPE